jgi:hypothetical protein
VVATVFLIQENEREAVKIAIMLYLLGTTKDPESEETRFCLPFYPTLSKKAAKSLLRLLCAFPSSWEILTIENCASSSGLDALLQKICTLEIFQSIVLMGYGKSPPRLPLSYSNHLIHPRLKVLKLRGFTLSREEAAMLRQGIESRNTRLCSLAVHDLEFNPYALQELAQGIQSNRTIRELTVKFAIQSNRTIRDLTVKFASQLLHSPAILIEAIVGHPIIKVLDLTAMDLRVGVFITDFDTSLTRLVSVPTCQLATLRLCTNPQSLSSMLQEMTINHSIKSLTLEPLRGRMHDDRGRMRDDDSYDNLWKFHSLEHLHLLNYPLSTLPFECLIQRPMLSLKRLSFDGFSWQIAMDGQAEPLLQVLCANPNLMEIRDSNNNEFHMTWGLRSSLWMQIRHLQDTRRAFLPKASNIPLALWPLCLERANRVFGDDPERLASAIFFLLSDPAFVAFPLNGCVDWDSRPSNAAASQVKCRPNSFVQRCRKFWNRLRYRENVSSEVSSRNMTLTYAGIDSFGCCSQH